MEQLSVAKTPALQLYVCEAYQREKESYALFSPERPAKQKTLPHSFRQTTFPNLIRNASKN